MKFSLKFTRRKIWTTLNDCRCLLTSSTFLGGSVTKTHENFSRRKEEDEKAEKNTDKEIEKENKDGGHFLERGRG